MTRFATILALALVCIADVAVAGTFGQPTFSTRPTKDATSIKVLEPDGFAVTITTTKGEESGAVPEVFTVANRDQFVWVAIKAPDGTQWKQKIELEANTQKLLRIGFTASAPAAQARRFLGRLTNTVGECFDHYDNPIKFEFLDASGAAQGTIVVEAGRTRNLELPAGKYDTRVYSGEGKSWRFLGTYKVEVTGDGWKRAYGCYFAGPPNVDMFVPR